MQIFIILRKILKYSTVISTFSEHITIFRTLSIDIWQLKCQKNRKQIKQKMKNFFFFCKLFWIIKFFFLILLRDAILEAKVVPTNRNSSAFLLHTSKTFSNFELFSISSQLQTFWQLIFATKIKTMLCEKLGQ